MQTHDFQTQLKNLGINTGDTVLMHSSMKALKTDMTPEEFIREIIEAIGPDGTLLVPALTYSSVNTENPLFKAAETEPCIGLIPRTFFKMPGVVRSLHPTHSVCALGKLAGELCSAHINDETPVGPNSPFMKITKYGGKLLFIGEVVKSCTFMHGVEEAAGAPYALMREYTDYTLVDTDGKIIKKKYIRHNFKGYTQEYQRIKDILPYPEIKTGKVGEADCYLIESAALLEKAVAKIRENPFYFVDTKDEPE